MPLDEGSFQKKAKSITTKFTKKSTKITKNRTRTRNILGGPGASLVFLVVNLCLFECESV